MVNENNIPIENKKPFETVYELKEEHQVPTFEEFMKTYEWSEEMVNSYNLEVDSYKDISIGKLSGPMPFVDEATALIVARADAVMTRLKRDYPNVVSLFNHNRSGTVEWLKAEGALAGYNVVHSFRIDFTDRTSKNGPEAWRCYREEIEKYVEKLCKDWRDNKGDFRSRLRRARKDLSDHIHKKYFDRLPNWPKKGETNMASIEVDTGGAYEADSYYIVWSCVGWVSIKDQRPESYIYMAEFSGKPDTKILQIDFDKLGELNRKINCLGLESAKAMIDAKEGTRDPKLLTWEDFK
jgi:hypothetical protein